MKKLLAALFCTLAMLGNVFAEDISYEIDPVATAKAQWKAGGKIFKEGHCGKVQAYREFLGITQSGFALVQDFYLSGEKLTDPFLMSIMAAGESWEMSCLEGIEGKYVQWYRDGKKKAVNTFKNGQFNGFSQGWYKNGNKLTECNFKDNKEVGVCRVWDIDGNLIREKDYGTPEN